MNIQQAITILKLHNQWRRGKEVKMLPPRVIGEAIDTVVAAYEHKITIT